MADVEAKCKNRWGAPMAAAAVVMIGRRLSITQTHHHRYSQFKTLRFLNLLLLSKKGVIKIASTYSIQKISHVFSLVDS